MQNFRREDYTYTRYFCEENIWLLAKSLIDRGIPADDLQVLILSTPSESVVLFNQRAAPEGAPLSWDYHVILQATLDGHPYIFDFDSRLAFPEKRDTSSSQPNRCACLLRWCRSRARFT